MEFGHILWTILHKKLHTLPLNVIINSRFTHERTPRREHPGEKNDDLGWTYLYP